MAVLFYYILTVDQLEAELRDTKTKLEDSERQRQLSDEQAEKSRRSYESEISWLKLQLSTYEQDFKSERRAREATATTLEQVRGELAVAQRQVSRYASLYLFIFITSDKGGGICICPCLSVCLSVSKITRKTRA